MLSVTAVTQDRLYKANVHGSAPSLPFLPNKPPQTAKQAFKTQKLLSDLNSEFLNNSIATRRHSIETKLQTESFMTATEPKISLYQHQTDANRKTLANIEQRLNSMCAETLTHIKRKRTDLDLGQTVITNKVKTEFENITDLVSKQVKRTDWINGITQTKTTETIQSVGDLKQKSDDVSMNAEKIFENARGKIKTLRPRFVNADLKVQELESTVQSILAQYREFQRMMEQLKNTNRMLKYLRDEGVNNMVSEHYQRLIAHLSEQSIAFDKKMGENDMNAAAAEEKTKMQQSEVISTNEQLDKLAKALQDNESKIASFDGTSDENIQYVVNKLNQIVTQLKDEIKKQRTEIHHQKWLKVRVVNRQLNTVSKSAQLNLEKLSDDWTEFKTNNVAIQKDVDKYIENINKTSGGSIDQISARVDLAAARIAWCQKRFLQWARNGADNSVALQKIIEAEKNLSKLEQSLQRLDRQKASTPPYQVVQENPNYIKDPVPLPGTSGQDESNEMPNKRLTYSQEDMEKPLIEADPDPFEEEDFVDNEEEPNIFSFMHHDPKQEENNYPDLNEEEKPKPNPKSEEKPKKEPKSEEKQKPEQKDRQLPLKKNLTESDFVKPKEKPQEKRPLSQEQKPSF